jgi:dihydrofolate reductase
MTKILLDTAMTLDGFWADGEGSSVFPIAELHDSGLVLPLIQRTGAAVMSRRSFDMADDPDWYADNYELQVPIFVVTDDPPAQSPRTNGRISFTFVASFREALVAAREASRGRDVLIVGEASAVRSALAEDAVDELYVRIVPRLLGTGIPLFGAGQRPQDFRRIDIATTATAVHLHLGRPT